MSATARPRQEPGCCIGDQAGRRRDHRERRLWPGPHGDQVPASSPVVARRRLDAYFLGVSPLAILLVAAALVAVVENRDRWARPAGAEKWDRPRPRGARARGCISPGTSGRRRPAARPSLSAVFLEFLKLGSIVFGSGYVLVSYLHSDLVLPTTGLASPSCWRPWRSARSRPGPSSRRRPRSVTSSAACPGRSSPPSASSCPRSCSSPPSCRC